MSLLEKFEEMHRRIIALERLVGVTGEESEQACTVVIKEPETVAKGGSEAIAWETWYLNIPEEGVECWVEDSERKVRAERDEDYEDTIIVYRYDSSVDMRFDTNVYRWKYAIPVDPELRLPNGLIVL